jgi:hypothetical protein
LYSYIAVAIKTPTAIAEAAMHINIRLSLFLVKILGNQLMIRRLHPIMLQIVCGLMSFILSYFTLFLLLQ